MKVPTAHRFCGSTLRSLAEQPPRLGHYAALTATVLGLLWYSPTQATLAEYQSTVTNEPNLISYYTFEQEDATDVHGANAGTLMDATAFAAGAQGFGKALVLNGASRVNLGVVEDFAFTDGIGSIEAWLQAGDFSGISGYNNPAIFANRDGATRWSIHMNKDKSGIGMWNGTDYFPTISIPNPSTNWHHLVVVFEGDYLTVYWDGVLRIPAIYRPLGYTDVTQGTQLGSVSPSANTRENWVGMLDEVAFYASALTADDVQRHYEAFPFPPVITKHPRSGTHMPGAILSVEATGPNLVYQWYKDATALAGETSSMLTLSGLVGDTATYRVSISNTAAIVWGDPAAVVLAALPVPLARYQAAVSNEATLISYYTFDRLMPEDVYGPNEGTLAGTAGYGTGIGGGAAKGLLLDGAGHVNLGSVYELNFPSGEGTVEGWIRADWTNTADGVYRCMFADRDSAAGFNAATWSLHLSANKASLTYFNGNGSDDYTVPGGAGAGWHHFAAVLSNGSNTYYWDGSPITTKIRALGPDYWTVQLGSSASASTSEGWIGMLDEVAFYSTALPVASIQAHYNAYAAGDPPIITSQPVGGYFLVGQLGQLSVGAAGAQLTYQWYKDGTLLPGMTNAVIGPLALTTDFSGDYSVRVTNPSGSTNSATAIVQVGNNMARYQTTVLGESSLISCYTFDASDAQDARNAHPGTVANAVAFETGPGGATNLSLTLDGTGHIDLGQVADFDFADGSGTVEGWIRPNWINPAPYDPCLFADREGESSVWSVHMGAWKTLMVNFSAGAQTLPIGSDSGWHHYAIVFDAGAVSMYWDGKPRGSFNQAINSSSAKTTQIGSSAALTTVEGWMGGLDEVAFYDAALGPAAIWNHYLAMVGPESPPTLSYSLAGTQLTLSWPTDVTGFILEYAESLPASSWTPVSGVVNNQVTVSASIGRRFFRLSK